MKRPKISYKGEMLFDQTLEEIRLELGQAEISAVSDEEYITMLSRHTSNLVEVVQQINLNSGKPDSFESILSLLFNNLIEPICIVDEDTNPLFFNPGWEKLFKGIKGGMVLENLLTKKDYRSLQNSIEDSGAEGKRKILTLNIKKKRKIVSILPFYGFDKKPKFLLIAFADDFVRQITKAERKDETTSHNAKSGSFQEEILDLIDGFYFVINDKLSFQFVSASVQEQLGFRTSELINKNLATILPGNSVDKVKEALKGTIHDNKTSSGKIKLEIELLDVENKSCFCELNISKNDRSGLWMGICLNIHEFKMREKNLIREKKTAELNDRMKSDFLANMSHEIRTPLNGIIGFSTMLSRDEIGDIKRDKFLRIIQSSTTHLLTLVSDIIDHSKIEAGQLKIVFHKVNVHQVLDDLLATFISEAGRLEKKNLRIIKQVPRPKSLFIQSDEIRLKQVLSNFIGNALKFTAEGEISFGYSLETTGSIRFFVRDSGIGIAPSSQKTIFTRYKQTSEGKKEKYEGTGLGLAISKGIIGLMGGKIGVNSEQGKGSEFYFLLPLEECE